MIGISHGHIKRNSTLIWSRSICFEDDRRFLCLGCCFIQCLDMKSMIEFDKTNYGALKKLNFCTCQEYQLKYINNQLRRSRYSENYYSANTFELRSKKL